MNFSYSYFIFFSTDHCDGWAACKGQDLHSKETDQVKHGPALEYENISRTIMTHQKHSDTYTGNIIHKHIFVYASNMFFSL